MKRHTNLLTFFVIIIISFFLVPTKADTYFSATNASPGSFYINKNDLKPCMIYEWNFAISASKLRVMAFNSSQYSILEDNRDSTDYTAILNTISYPGQSGEWSPPFQDTWYIIYRNVGSSNYNMQVRTSVKDYNCFIPYILGFGVAIVAVVAVVVIFYFFVYKPRRTSRTTNRNFTWEDKLNE